MQFGEWNPEYFKKSKSFRTCFQGQMSLKINLTHSSPHIQMLVCDMNIYKEKTKIGCVFYSDSVSAK